MQSYESPRALVWTTATAEQAPRLMADFVFVIQSNSFKVAEGSGSYISTTPNYLPREPVPKESSLLLPFPARGCAEDMLLAFLNERWFQKYKMGREGHSYYCHIREPGGDWVRLLPTLPLAKA